MQINYIRIDRNSELKYSCRLVLPNLKWNKDSQVNNICCLKPVKTFALFNTMINNILSDSTLKFIPV
jgi:hypothetical protein